MRRVTFLFVCLFVFPTDVVRPGGSSAAKQQGEKVSSPEENSSKEGVGGEHPLGHFRVTFYGSVAFFDRLKYRHFVFPVNPPHITVTSVVQKAYEQ